MKFLPSAWSLSNGEVYIVDNIQKITIFDREEGKFDKHPMRFYIGINGKNRITNILELKEAQQAFKELIEALKQDSEEVLQNWANKWKTI